MIAYYCDHFVLPLPDGHRFPMRKYSRLRERVVDEGILHAEELHVPEAADDHALLRAHAADYVRRVTRGELSAHEVRRIGFPWSPELVERSRRSAGGTIAASRQALRDGVSANLAGGTHHAFADRGEGFCVFNDSAVAARALQAEGRVGRVLIVDLDVHQGNGTAAIFRDDPSVFTLSVHCDANYPFEKEPGDLDVPLPIGTGDDHFLEAVRAALVVGFERARPDLVIYVSGADAHEGDRLGRMAVTAWGMAERDRLVFERARAAGVPVAVTMAGGYGKDVEQTVAIHLATIRAAVESSRAGAGARAAGQVPSSSV